MMAKCDQKQIPVPSYSQYRDYSDYENAQKIYSKNIMGNKERFPILAKEYSTYCLFTNRHLILCSYLKDFVTKREVRTARYR